MGKLLKVLVVILLVLSAASLTLGIMLFGKRELLKGRTQKLEETVIALGPWIEAQQAKVDRPEDYPSRDTSPCTSEILDNPERSDFWSKYSQDLEIQDILKLDLGSEKKREELMHYYRIDPLTGKPARNVQGFLETSGEGTMAAVLEELKTRAEAQHKRLNATRQQLKVVREELVATITDLNGQKKTLREKLKKIDELNAEIAKLNETITKLNDEIKALKEDIKTKEDTINENKREIAKLQDDAKKKDDDIALLKKQLADVVSRPTTEPTQAQVGKAGTPQPVEIKAPRGPKGQVVEVDQDWDFVVLNLQDDFLKLVLGENLDAGMPYGVDLLVRRPGKPADTYVAKVRLVQYRKHKNVVIADVLPGWQQLPVQKGDIVLF